MNDLNLNINTSTKTPSESAEPSVDRFKDDELKSATDRKVKSYAID